MAALSVTAAQVLHSEGPVQGDAIAGEAFAAGDALYYNTSDGKWWKGQGDGTAIQAGSANVGIALATADVAGARVSVALPGAIVTLGAGAAPAAGVPYFFGDTTGAIVPLGDLGSGDKVTVIALGCGSNQVKVAHVYHSGSEIA